MRRHCMVQWSRAQKALLFPHERSCGQTKRLNVWCVSQSPTLLDPSCLWNLSDFFFWEFLSAAQTSWTVVPEPCQPRKLTLAKSGSLSTLMSSTLMSSTSRTLRNKAPQSLFSGLLSSAHLEQRVSFLIPSRSKCFPVSQCLWQVPQSAVGAIHLQRHANFVTPPSSFVTDCHIWVTASPPCDVT